MLSGQRFMPRLTHTSHKGASKVILVRIPPNFKNCCHRRKRYQTHFRFHDFSPSPL